MRVLVVLFAAIACTVASPAAVSYAYSAISPLTSHYAAAYSPFAYAAGPVAAYGAGPIAAYGAVPAVVRASPVVPAASPIVPYASPVAPLAYAAPAPVVAAGVKSQYHAQDEFGQASYGHVEPAQAHHAIQDAAGNKVGSYSFINPEGKFVQTNYVADAAGYRVASNDLPVAPVHSAVPPAPVVDTPEVAAAKAAHLVKLAEASRSKRSVTPAATTPLVAAPAIAPVASVVAAPYAHAYSAYPYAPAAYPYGAYPYATAYPHAYPTTAVQPVTTPQGYNLDTPEVAAAKANHFAEHAARAHVYPFIY